MRDFTITRKKGELYHAIVTDSYGNKYENFFEHAHEANDWIYYIWSKEEWFNSANSQELLANALNDGRYELNNFLNILKQTSQGAGKTAQTELKELFKKRLEGYVGNSFKIFETKSNIFNFFRK